MNSRACIRMLLQLPFNPLLLRGMLLLVKLGATFLNNSRCHTYQQALFKSGVCADGPPPAVVDFEFESTLCVICGLDAPKRSAAHLRHPKLKLNIPA